MSISRSCQLFGYTRQGYYKRKKVRTESYRQEKQVLELVHGKRLKLPRLGNRKLHFLLQEDFAERDLKTGRGIGFSRSCAATACSSGPA